MDGVRLIAPRDTDHTLYTRLPTLLANLQTYTYMVA